MAGRTFLIVIDGLGIGAQEDAFEYGNEDADTLGNLSRLAGLKVPVLEQLGLGNIRELDTVKPVQQPGAFYGKMREKSAGKDSTTGHWELAGILLDQPFPVYPAGFPGDVICRFCEKTGNRQLLCNRPGSGTDVIRDFGLLHLETGAPIVYTSADSVFQIACHTDVVPVETLWNWCEIARNEVMIGEHAVGRVIARPFSGAPGEFRRISEKRHDYSIEPPEPNLLSLLQDHGVTTISVGKVIDLFAGKGFDQSFPTTGNSDGLQKLKQVMDDAPEESFTFVNLIDTDQIYGHRQDTEGFARCLEEIDRELPAILEKMQEEDLLFITGDHGNDPADHSTDHTREFVPILAVKQGIEQGRALGDRASFSDVAATILEAHGVREKLSGSSFLKEMEKE